jgi:hypothetical protein
MKYIRPRTKKSNREKRPKLLIGVLKRKGGTLAVPPPI